MNKRAYLRAMFVLDTSVLSPFARAERLDTLRELLSSSRVVITEAVREELRNGMKNHPELIAMLDDEVAAKLGREQSIAVIRTLRLIADAVQGKTLAVRDAEALVDQLGAAGGRYPCTGSELAAFLRQHQML